MKVLIIGGSGFLGYFILNNLKVRNSVNYTYYKNQIPNESGFQLDISKKTEVLNLILKINPDVIIYTPALTVDLSETNKELAEQIHVNAIQNIIEGCRTTSSKLVYISTTYVFDGSKIFLEDDVVIPGNNYGLSKLKAENLVKDSELPFLILRTDQPYYWKKHWQHNNSVLRVMDTLSQNKILEEVEDWYSVPTFVPDFVNALEKLLQLNKTGIFHLTGSDYISRYEWSILVAEIFNLNKDLIHPINSSSLNLPAKRFNINVSNDKIFKETGIKMKTVKEGLIEMFNTKLNNY
jgi:dTDP-4-dehydrorhamnose reductase